MYMLIFVLNDPDKLDELLDGWEKAGVSGVTILPSTGLGRIRQFKGLRDDIPIIPGLDDLYQRDEEFSRTMFTIIKDKKLIDKIVKITRKIAGDLDQPDTGLLIILPITQAYGLDKKSPKMD